MPLYVFEVGSERTIYRAKNMKSLKHYIINHIDDFKYLFLSMCWNSSKFKERLPHIYKATNSNDLFEVKESWNQTKRHIISKLKNLKSNQLIEEFNGKSGYDEDTIIYHYIEIYKITKDIV